MATRKKAKRVPKKKKSARVRVVAPKRRAKAPFKLTGAAAAFTGLTSGVDLSSNSSAQLQCLVGAGIQFIGRYYARDKKPKVIQPAEATAIGKANLSVVAVWEDGNPTAAAYFSHAKGVSDGTDAYHCAQTIGQPATTPIYFAVDYDAKAADISGAISDYFRGVAAGLSKANGGTPSYPVGAYGSGNVCKALLSGGLATYTWLAQSKGWGGYNQYQDWNIKQGPTGTLCKLSVDSDQAKATYGGFKVA